MALLDMTVWELLGYHMVIRWVSKALPPMPVNSTHYQYMVWLSALQTVWSPMVGGILHWHSITQLVWATGPGVHWSATNSSVFAVRWHMANVLHQWRVGTPRCTAKHMLRCATLWAALHCGRGHLWVCWAMLAELCTPLELIAAVMQKRLPDGQKKKGMVALVHKHLYVTHVLTRTINPLVCVLCMCLDMCNVWDNATTFAYFDTNRLAHWTTFSLLVTCALAECVDSVHTHSSVLHNLHRVDGVAIPNISCCVGVMMYGWAGVYWNSPLMLLTFVIGTIFHTHPRSTVLKYVDICTNLVIIIVGHLHLSKYHAWLVPMLCVTFVVNTGLEIVYRRWTPAIANLVHFTLVQGMGVYGYSILHAREPCNPVFFRC